MRVALTSYVGTGVDGLTVALTDCTPDFCFVQGTAHDGVWRTSTMAGDKTKLCISNTAVFAGAITALGTNQITLGTDARVNTLGETYYVWAVEDNGAGDFTVMTYTGDGVDGRVLPLTGITSPAMVWGCNEAGNHSVWRTNVAPGTKESYSFSTGGLLGNEFEAMGAASITLGDSAVVNFTTHTYHLALWKNCALFSATGYTGDGADDRSLTGAGFDPTMVAVLQSRANLARPTMWRHPAQGAGDLTAFHNAGGTNTNRIQAFISNGIQIGNQSQVNTNLEAYQYAVTAAGTTGGGVPPVARTWPNLYETHIQQTKLVQNAHRDTAYPTWEITGPGEYLILRNETTGAVLTLTGEIFRTETVAIDMDPTQRTVRGSIQGELRTRLLDGSQFWGLAPGSNQIFVELGQTLPESRVVLRLPSR